MLAKPEEQICLDARRHGVVLARPLLRALALAAAGGAALWLGWPATIAGAVLLAAAAALALRAVWGWDRTRVVVTTEKLFVVQGILGRRGASVRLRGVEAIELEQTLPGRLLGYGTLVVGALEVAYVPQPRRVYHLLERLAG
ncbi:MAG TPA: PH domain-containing protein [Gaiellaceae bacterium]|nr:PH domain-containing protein [Gaiellaceae bacterium]